MTNELNSTAMIQNCLFEFNESADNNIAGALLNVDSNPIVTDCVFRNNTAGILGGAVHNLRGTSPKFINCRFEDNIVTTTSARGGAISNQNSTIVVDNCIFLRNSVVLDGGAVYGVTSDITIRSSTFVGNSARSGGAVNVLRGTVAIIDSILVGNDATNGAQLALVDNSVADLSFTDIVGNADGVFLFLSTLQLGPGVFDVDPLFVETFAFRNLLSNLPPDKPQTALHLMPVVPSP
ncbi:MAG: right-handed parallel beta-helix repeat-containing protein [Planctomycetes bacterium]|nr:right-handed parallel beta-helix repeat-containing protein [Planctomycetota bacterium]